MAAPVKRRRLGRTGLEVSEIGFGAWGIGGTQWLGSDDHTSLAAVTRALDCGVNFFDTALAYGDGHSEQVLARALLGRPEPVVIATKVPPKNNRWPARPGIPLKKVFPYRWIVECTERSLRNLGREAVDIQQFHVWNPEWVGEDDWPRAIEDLKRAGKVRFFGISANDHEPSSVLSALATGLVDTVQVIYNIFDPTPEDELFPACRERDIGVIARVPFDEGSLTGAITPDTKFPLGDFRRSYFRGDRKRQVAERVARLRAALGDREPLAQTALRFCLSHPAVGSVIPGMRRPAHVEANAAASAAGPLDAQTLELLRAHRWPRNFYSD
jgi:aryl-alcohol dehydrogenase-like predicted oxidoreductase